MFTDGLKGGMDQKAVKSALHAWFHEVLRARWKSPADILKTYAHASIVGKDRVVFNIKGNNYRLVVTISYLHQIVFIKWIGTHADYDHIDVKTGNMDIKPIRTEADYDRALRRVEKLWDSPKGSAQSDELDILATLIEAYERQHYPIDLPSPIEAIKFRLEQQGTDTRVLIGVIGQRTRVYEVMQGKRPLSLNMIRNLHQKFGIPAEVLIRPARQGRRAARHLPGTKIGRTRIRKSA